MHLSQNCWTSFFCTTCLLLGTISMKATQHRRHTMPHKSRTDTHQERARAAALTLAHLHTALSFGGNPSCVAEKAAVRGGGTPNSRINGVDHLQHATWSSWCPPMYPHHSSFGLIRPESASAAHHVSCPDFAVPRNIHATYAGELHEKMCVCVCERCAMIMIPDIFSRATAHPSGRSQQLEVGIY